jgi:predicted DNA binding CopG/RHH family protein
MKNKKSIPKFASDDKAAAFWETHDLTDYFDQDDQVDLVLPNLKKSARKRVQVQLPEWVIQRYKQIAREKDISYTELIGSILTRSASHHSSHQ